MESIYVTIYANCQCAAKDSTRILLVSLRQEWSPDEGKVTTVCKVTPYLQKSDEADSIDGRVEVHDIISKNQARLTVVAYS